LHGIYHDDANDIIEDFFYLNEPPFEIITGKSSIMIKKVDDVCRSFGYLYFFRDFNNIGSIVIIEGDL